MVKTEAPKAVKTAAIVSEGLLILWALLLLLSSLFQESLLLKLTRGYIPEGINKIVLNSGIVMCIAALAITACNAMLSKGKGKYMSLVFSALTIAILPPAAYIANSVQTQSTALLEGSEALAALGIYAKAVSALSYLLYAAAIITIAASAVYAYANNPMNKSSERT